MFFSADKRLTKAFKNAKKLPLNSQSKYVLFSDCHRGDNSFADDFSHNRKIYDFALSKYFEDGFTYIELGDGDELWENNFNSIFKANKEVYFLLRKFHNQNRLHFIWGNHDMEYRNPKKVAKNLATYYDEVDDRVKDLLPNASFSEAILLEQENKKSVFLLHGHQADLFNYVFWRLSRLMVKLVWRPLQILGVKDPTSPAQNFRGRIKVERYLERWISKNNQMTIVGHTHRPHFPKPNQIPYFNDGSCVHPRCITGIEINENKIALVKWHFITTKDGVMQIIRTVLEEAQNLSNYLK